MGDLNGELLQRLPADRIQTDPDVVAAYAQDRAIFEKGGTAALLVSPRSTEEVVAAMQAAVAADAIVVPRGAGTGLTGAANAIDGCLMVSLHRMNNVLDIDPINRMTRVQPGVINSDLKAAVSAHGLYYPPDPASYEMSSIGGNVATNAGGLCCVKYGVTRDYVIGLEVVLSNGDVIRTGRHTIKSTTGLDLTGLFVGSEGLLGIITEITLKLEPTPPAQATAVAYFEKLSNAGQAIQDIFAAGLQPTVMEIIDQRSLQFVEQFFPMGLDTEAACLILLQASTVDQPIGRFVEHFENNGASSLYHAADPDEGELMLEVRRKVWPALERLERSLLPEDVAVTRERLPELLAGIVEITTNHEVVCPVIGHAGDGNMHPIFVFDEQDKDELDRVKVAFAEIITLSLELGGTMAAEHGVGTLKRQFIEDEIEPVHLGVQRSVKALFDPDNRLNPGKAL